ncbi:MAG: transglutaminase family protein [Spirochaetes bacterium]|nr:transglutaminase family protein [Spirochaetota bacterium]
MKPESDKIENYLTADSIINWKDPAIIETAYELIAGIRNETAKARVLFEWVRDKISHSNDAGIKIVTCVASDVLKHKTGSCYAKSHLLAALLRAARIPSGFCYQVLRRDPPFENELILHGLNGIYLASIEKWIRVDARGNKPGVNAQFSIEKEQLAFHMDISAGEFIYDTIFTAPVKNVTDKLLKYKTVPELWRDLPDKLI